MSKFLMSYTEALTIQRAQMVFYRHAIGRKGCKAIRQRTIPCPADIHPDEKIPISRINELVPRGGCFEQYFTKFPKSPDSTRIDWYNAIRRGLF